MPLQTWLFYERYFSYTQPELANLITRTLTQRPVPDDETWCSWLIEYCLFDLRPSKSYDTPKQSLEWLFFVMMYIHPLLAKPRGSVIPSSIAAEALTERREIVKALLFGESAVVRDALMRAYDLRPGDTTAFRAIELSPIQDARYQAVLERLPSKRDPISDRTARQYARFWYAKDEQVSELAKRVYDFLHGQPHLDLPALWQILARQARYSGQKAALFEMYVNRTLKDPGCNQWFGQALACLLEYKRRSALLNFYGRGFRYSCYALGGAAVIGILVLWAMLPTFLDVPVKALLLLVGAAGLVGMPLLIVLVITTLIDTDSWAQAALSTLAILFDGPTEPDDSKTEESGLDK